MQQTERPSRFAATLQQCGDTRRSKGAAARHLWGAAGILCFALGAAGAALPLLPTTPFILLAALCFARSSRKLDLWFRRTKLYRTVFEGLLTRRAMTLSAKLKLLVPVTVLLGISFALMGSVPIGRAVVAAIFAGHVVYFGFMVKTEKPARADASPCPESGAFSSPCAVPEDRYPVQL